MALISGSSQYGQYDPETGTYWTPYGGGSSPIPGVNYGPLAPTAGLPTINQDSNIKPIEVGSGQNWDFSSLGSLGSGDTLDIPEDAYPWSKSHSGLQDWGLEPLKEIAPRLPGLMDSFQGSLDQLGNLPGLVDQWTNAEGKAYVNQLQPFQDYIRQPMEKLASRGVLDSTMQRDALTNLSGMLADDVRQHQDQVAAQGLQTKAAGLVDTAKLNGMAAELLGSLLDLGRTQDSESQDKLSRYTGILSALFA